MTYRLSHQLRSFLLPIGVAGVVPFLLVVRFDPLRLRQPFQILFVQLPIGTALFLLGLLLLVASIRLIIKRGGGTLAPWNPTQKLVTEGIYEYVRNPMISGVAFMILGESGAFGSLALLIFLLCFIVVNTVYFKLSEEPGLLKRFGDEYREYRKHVWMWIPRLKPWRPDSGMSHEGKTFQ
jgi:protein-S-isoprenylcysteine O-methyltransferase Ste14